MIAKIKKIWKRLDSDRMKMVVEYSMRDFGLTSEHAFRQNWIYLERIPEKHQGDLLRIVKNALTLQIEEMQSLLEAA